MPAHQIPSTLEEWLTLAESLPVGSDLSVADGFESLADASRLAQRFADRVLIVLEGLPEQMQPGEMVSLFTVHDLAPDLRDIPEPHGVGVADASMQSQSFVSKVRQRLFQSLHSAPNGFFLMDGSQVSGPEVDTERLLHFRTTKPQRATRRLEIVAEDLRVPHMQLLRRYPTLAVRRMISGLIR